MTIEIKKDDTPEEIEKKVKDFSIELEKGKKERLLKFFGILKLNEEPMTLQRRWL